MDLSDIKDLHRRGIKLDSVILTNSLHNRDERVFYWLLEEGYVLDNPIESADVAYTMIYNERYDRLAEFFRIVKERKFADPNWDWMRERAYSNNHGVVLRWLSERR